MGMRRQHCNLMSPGDEPLGQPLGIDRQATGMGTVVGEDNQDLHAVGFTSLHVGQRQTGACATSANLLRPLSRLKQPPVGDNPLEEPTDAGLDSNLGPPF